MRDIDLTKLIEGLLVVIVAAMAIGRYNDLRAFAGREAAASLRGWGTHAFFPATYRRVIRSSSTGLGHRKGPARESSPVRLDQPKHYNKGDLLPISKTDT